MPEPAPNPRKSFLWQVVLILLPVVALAAVGMISLRKDRRQVEQEARERCQELAGNLGRAIEDTFNQELHDYANGQLRWLTDRRTEADLVAAPAELSPLQKETQNRVNQWVQSHPDLDLAAMPQAMWNLIDDTTRLRTPPDYDSPPRPPDWVSDLTELQRQLWQTAQQNGFAQPDNTLAIEALDQLAATNPHPDAIANAELLRLSIQSRDAFQPEARQALIELAGRMWDTRTDGGLPLPQIVFARVLATRPEEQWLQTNFFRIANATVHLPSVLSPVLLDKLSKAAGTTNPVLRRKIDALRLVWNSEEQTRHVLHHFLRQHESSAWGDRCFWIDSESGNFLASMRKPVAQPGQSTAGTNGPPDKTFTVSLFPRSIVEEAFARGFERSKSSIPRYATASIDLAGRSLDRAKTGRFETLPVTNRVTLASFQPVSAPFHLPGNFTVHLDLARADLLYAAQRQRALWFGAVIALAAAAAVVGCWQAWRTLRRQIELNHLQSNFVSSVSHELRAPIASVRLMAEGLESGRVRDESRRSEYFRLIVQECRRLSSLIENVLDYSRIEQGRKEYALDPIDPVALVEQTVRLMQTHAEERPVRLETVLSIAGLDDTGTQLLGDGRALQQALVNLIDNAIKHSPAGTVVTVGLELGRPEVPPPNERTPGPAPGDSRQCLHLWVEDQGEGIPAGEQTRIFDRFYRLGSELRRETQGVGIGLSIVKHIVDAHGGRILVRSALGEGSRFTIELPLEQSERPK